MLIEKCKIKYKELLVSYIDQSWQKDHVLVRNEELLNWQHLNNLSYNFYVFIKQDKVCGILGFIPTFQYDENLKKNKDLFGAIWSVNKLAPPAAGYMLMKKLISCESPKFIGFVGISEQAKFFYKKWNLKINHLNHYYMVNNNIKTFNILKGDIIQNNKLQEDNSDLKLVKIDDLREVSLIHNYKPKKTIKYLINRYENHPVYKYFFYILEDSCKNAICIFIFRKQKYLNSSCLRIIDVFGSIDNVGSLKKHFQNLLLLEDSEYVDILNYGISDKIFEKLGFSKLDFSTDKIIIPNFFNPFVQENIKIEFSYKSDYDDFVIFRGDGDQDRPS